MSNNNKTIAEAYYSAMGQKDLNAIEGYADQNIHFVGPFAEFSGKQQYLKITENFMAELESLDIRAVVSSSNQASVIYDVHFPKPIGKIRGAALMDFAGDKVVRIELFYDTKAIEQKANDIFSS